MELVRRRNILGRWRIMNPEPPLVGSLEKRTSLCSMRTSSSLAAAVARQILTDVVDRGWPVGEVLGSQTALIERYGVSRAVFREAVRLVENQQGATMGRG